MFNKLLKFGLSGCIALCILMVSPVWATEGNAFSECSVVIAPGDAVALHDALDNTDNEEGIICLKGGTYKPHPTDRDVSFEVNINNVTLRGLIQAEGSGSNHGVRLSGNIGSPSIKEDNSLHVVTIREQTGVVIENLTIADGYNEQTRDTATGSGNGWGAGLLAVLSDVTLKRVIVRNNEMAFDGSGAGVAGLNSDLTLYHSIVQDNISADDTGGVYGRDIPGLSAVPFSVLISHSLFQNNIATGLGGGGEAFGAAIQVFGQAAPNNRAQLLEVRHSTFLGNVVGATDETGNVINLGSGGAISAFRVDNVIVDISTFTNNKALGTNGQGGALRVSSVTNAMVSDNTFKGNSGALGGAFEAVGGNSIVNHNSFEGNTAETGGAIAAIGALTANNNSFINNSASGIPNFFGQGEDVGGGAIAQIGAGFFGLGGNLLELNNNVFDGNSDTSTLGLGDHIQCSLGAIIESRTGNQFDNPGLADPNSVVGCTAP